MSRLVRRWMVIRGLCLGEVSLWQIVSPEKCLTRRRKRGQEYPDVEYWGERN